MAENTTEKTTMEKTIEELKAQLAKAKEAASKCDSSTLAKVGKVGLGVVVITGAAYAGYWYGSQEPNDTTTIEYK